MFLETLITDINELISATKNLYYENLEKKLTNLLLLAKTYWSIIKTFYNEKNVPLVPPLLIDNMFVTDIRTKANFSNKFFTEQCTPLKKSSVLPLNQMFLTQFRLNSLDLFIVSLVKRMMNLTNSYLIFRSS